MSRGLSDTILDDLCPGDEDPPDGWDPDLTIDQLVLAAEADLQAGAPDVVSGERECCSIEF